MANRICESMASSIKIDGLDRDIDPMGCLAMFWG
jgi:hypothetical protein